VRRLGRVAAVPPEAPDCSREHQRTLSVACVAGVAQRLTHVVILGGKTVVPLTLISSGQIRLGLLDQREKVVEVAVSDLLGLLALLKRLQRILADGLEHQEAPVADRFQQAPVDQRRNLVELGFRDLLRGIERKAAGKDSQPPEDRLQPGFQQRVAPLDRRAQCLLSDGRIARSAR
jgi:hypothetical protein